MNLLKRLASAAVAMVVVFFVLYIGSRFEVQWIVGLMLMIVAYLASIEYLQLMKRLDIQLAAPEFLIWVPVLTLSFIFFHGRYAEVVLMLAIAYQVLRYLGETPHRVGSLKPPPASSGCFTFPGCSTTSISSTWAASVRWRMWGQSTRWSSC